VEVSPLDAGVGESAEVDKPLDGGTTGVDGGMADPVDAGPGEAMPQPVREKPRPRPQASTGFLTVDAVPWAHITVEGKLVGQTPVARLTVPTGNVDIELRNPETGKMARRRVRVQADKESFVKVDLR
jgi:serine/threonine-protein kinase